MTSRRKGTRMNVEIAQRLAAMRREKGYSQEELANRLGLSRQAVSKWERAESSPDTGNLIALADLYGVTLDELVRVDVDMMLLVRRERHRIHRNRHHPIRRRAMLRRRPTDSTHPHVPRIVLGRRFRIPCCA